MDAEANSVREQFSRYGETEFTNWLEEGFADYYAMSNEYRFDPAWRYIDKLDSISDDLAWIYHKLVPAKQQPLFRSAIAEVLKSRAGDSEFPEAAVSDLLYLIPKVKAVEALLYLPRMVGGSRFAPEKHWLLFESIAQIKQLLPRRVAIDALYAVVTSRGFDDRYAFDILTSLCLKDPDRWPSHFKLLSGCLSRQMDVAKQVDEANGYQEWTMAFEAQRKRFFNTFLKYVTLADIIRRLNESDLSGINRLECDGAFQLLLQFVTGPLECSASRYKNDRKVLAYKVKISLRGVREPQLEITWERHNEDLNNLFGPFNPSVSELWDTAQRTSPIEADGIMANLLRATQPQERFPTQEGTFN